MVGLVKWSLVLVILCSSSIAAIRRIGEHLPTPDRGVDLHLGDCALPCWAGIMPGRTTIEEALGSLAEIFPPDEYDVQSNRLLVATDQEARTIAITRRSDPSQTLIQLEIVVLDHVVYAVVVTPRRTSDPTMGELITTYGYPTCVGITNSQRRGLIFFYTDLKGNRTLELSASSHWLAAVPVLSFSQADDPSICQAFPPWRGLSSYERYFRP